MALCQRISTKPGDFNPCGNVYGLKFTRDGKFLIASTNTPPPNVHVWRLDDGALVQSLDSGSAALGLSLSHDGKYLGVCGYGPMPGDPAIRVFDLESYEQRLAIAASPCVEIEFSSDDALIATNDTDSSVWNVSDGTLHAAFTGVSFYKLQFFPTEPRTLLTMGSYGPMVVDVASETWRLVDAARDTDVASVSLDGRFLVTTMLEGTVQLRQWPEGSVLHEMLVPGGANGVHNRIEWLTPELFLVLGWGSGIGTFWRIEENTLAHVSTFRGHFARPPAGSPDGKVVAVQTTVLDRPEPVHGFTLVTP